MDTNDARRKANDGTGEFEPEGRSSSSLAFAMESALVMRASLAPLFVPGKAALPPPRGFAAISVPRAFFFGGGGGGGRFSSGGGGRGGRGDDDDDAEESGGAGAVAAAAAAVAALGETEAAGDDTDAIVLHVGGMTCGGCAGKVKQILVSQPEVAAATIDLEKAVAFVRATPEAKAAKDWKKELGEKLASHLSACGFQSHHLLQDEGDAQQNDASAGSNDCP